MKNIFYFLTGIVLVLNSCVDDYTDANPPHLLDAPTFRVSRPSDDNGKITTVPINQFQNGYESIVSYGNPVEYTVSVIDAPGKVGEVSVSASIPDFGSVVLDDASVAALQGKESGDFKFTFMSNPNVPDQSDRSLNIVINVSDSQQDEKGEASPLTTTLTIPVTIYKCISDGLAEGIYTVTAASGNLDGGETYNLDSLEKYAEGNILVEVIIEGPGLYVINEVTGGVWPVFYSGRANPALLVDLCGTTITGREGFVSTGVGTAAQRTFTIDGTLNSDGTATITWSYVRDDGATPADPAKGSYTMALQ